MSFLDSLKEAIKSAPIPNPLDVNSIMRTATHIGRETTTKSLKEFDLSMSQDIEYYEDGTPINTHNFSTDGDVLMRIRLLDEEIFIDLREEPSTKSKRINRVNYHRVLPVHEVRDVNGQLWYKVEYYNDTGWVMGGGNMWVNVENNSMITRTDDNTIKDLYATHHVEDYDPHATQAREFDDEEEGDDLERYFTQEYFDELYSARNFSGFRSLTSVIGMPFQFLQSTDPRIDGARYGRRYTENIIFDMPLLTIQPGGPKFLAGQRIGGSERRGIMNAIADAPENLSDIIGNILNGKWARYYSFRSNYSSYIKYVNTMCRLAAHFMQIGDLEFNGQSYKYFDADMSRIESDGGTTAQSILGLNNAVHVYFNPNSSFSDNVSNNTRESMLGSTLNNVSHQAQEVRFLHGMVTGRGQDENLQHLIHSIEDQKHSMNWFNRIWEGARTTLFRGNNLIFPEIWSDSSFGKTFNIDVRLASPYGDPESVFLHVLRPLFHIVALATPRQFGPNGYAAPLT